MSYTKPAVQLKTDAEGNEIVDVYINNQPITFDQPAIIKQGYTLVPMRKIFEVLGAQVEWKEATQTVTAIKGNKVIDLEIGKDIATVNSEEVKLSQAPILMNERTLVPLRFVSEALGAGVCWDDYNQRVAIANYNNITKNDVLSIKDVKFQLDGKDFAEISFNLFDLFWTLYDEANAGRALDEIILWFKKTRKT